MEHVTVPTVEQLVARSAAAYGEHPALECADGSITSYRQLERQVGAMCAALRDRGVGAGETVRIDVHDQALFPVAWLGAVTAGCIAAVCPLPAEEPTLLVDDVFVRTACASGAVAARATSALPSERDPGRVCCIIASSGTSAEPKPVELTQTGLLADACAGLALYGYPPGTRLVSLVPLSHAFGLVCDLLAGLAAGATLCFPEHPGAFLARLPQFKPTCLSVPPRMAGLLAKSARAAAHPEAITGGALTKMLCGGSGLAPNVEDDLAELGIRAHGCYGITECSPCVSVNADDPARFRRGTAGVTLACNTVSVSDEGEILVAGLNVMAGYHGRPDLTAHALRDGVLHTGDLGHVDADGFLHVDGRLDDVLVAGDGRKLAPEVAERALRGHAGIEDVLVYLHEHAFAADLVLAEEADPRAAEAFAREVDLGDGRRIEYVRVRTTALPTNRMGKVVRPR